MLRIFRSLISPKPEKPEQPAAGLAPPEVIDVDGAARFPLSAHISPQQGFPMIDWEAVRAWVDAIADEDVQSHAWGAAERAWLEHMRFALGPSYVLRETEGAFLLSSLEPNVAKATLSYIDKTLQRVVRVLDGIAQVAAWGKDILIVLDDDETYYRYVSNFYAQDGEFAASGGMFINAGCSHFVTVKYELRMIEPVIAHEMTHSCLSHLPIPLWLNEGLAVNTEQRLSPQGPGLLTPQQLHAKHVRFWGGSEIQQFWSGKSFERTDDGNLLSYDLARILVEQLSADWAAFRSFVCEANHADAGAAAAAEHLDVDLGAMVAAILERDSDDGFAPDPALWSAE